MRRKRKANSVSKKPVKKTKDKPLSYYKKKAVYVFNKWIRERDNGQPCISCGSMNTSDCSHYYSAGHYPQLRFDERNCNLSCKRCNLYLSGNLIPYRVALEKKIGKDELEKIDFIASIRTRVKRDKFFYMDIIERYQIEK